MSLENKELFKNKGIKNTKQRNIVLDVLKNEKKAISAEDIFIQSKKIDDNLSFSTIYRCLNTFIEKDIAQKYSTIDENIYVYAINQHEHEHYLKCLKCNQEIEIEACPIKTFEDYLEKNTGYEVSGHKLEIYGYCPKCK